MLHLAAGAPEMLHRLCGTLQMITFPRIFGSDFLSTESSGFLVWTLYWTLRKGRKIPEGLSKYELLKEHPW